MTGLRAISRSLLCALIFCAVAAPSALAAKGTTMYACESGAKIADYKDAHCDEKVTAGTGPFGHVEIKPLMETQVSVTNEKTASATSKSTNMSLFVKEILPKEDIGIVCEVVTSGTGAATHLENKEVKGMEAEGTTELKYEKCKVAIPIGEVCKVKEPIVIKSNVKTKVIREAPEEMGLETSATPKDWFSLIVIEENVAGKCTALTKSSPYASAGSTIGTPGGTVNGRGATVMTTQATTEKTLIVNGKPAALTSTTTIKMAGGGPAITFTTTEP